MNHAHLHKLLRELHGELLAARTVTPRDRDLLQHLAEDIRAIIDAEPASAPAGAYHPLRQRLAEGVTAFEVAPAVEPDAGERDRHPRAVQPLRTRGRTNCASRVTARARPSSFQLPRPVWRRGG